MHGHGHHIRPLREDLGLQGCLGLEFRLVYGFRPMIEHLGIKGLCRLTEKKMETTIHGLGLYMGSSKIYTVYCWCV